MWPDIQSGTAIQETLFYQQMIPVLCVEFGLKKMGLDGSIGNYLIWSISELGNSYHMRIRGHWSQVDSAPNS